MPAFNNTNSECAVYVYREGFLSAVGHDLKLGVMNFTIDVDEQPLAIRGEFHADSLRVIGVISDGRILEDEPPGSDRRQIEAAISRQILEAHQSPVITFHSTAIRRANDGYYVTGWLDLHGVRKELQFVVEQQANQAVTTVTVHQPDFGITPYRALWGALRVKPDVYVEIAVPMATSAEKPVSA
jgi:hypothetical protein